MKPVRFHPEAEVELAAEAKYDEERSPGLGERFTREVQAAIKLAATLPGIGSPYRYGTRRVFTKSFPFSVVYRELPTELVILALAPFSAETGLLARAKSERSGGQVTQSPGGWVTRMWLFELYLSRLFRPLPSRRRPRVRHALMVQPL